MGFRGLGFRVQGFRVYGLGLRGSGFRVQGLGVQGLGNRQMRGQLKTYDATESPIEGACFRYTMIRNFPNRRIVFRDVC